jgi:hypothetical protein
MSVSLDRPYCTLAELKAVLRIADTDTDDDDILKTAINNASRMIETITGKIFYKKTLTNFYMPGFYGGEGWRITNVQAGEAGGGKIWSRYKPIIEITELVEDGVTLTENTDFYIDKVVGYIVRASGNWNYEPREIKISGSFGYETDNDQTPADTQPGDVRTYCQRIAASLSGKNYVNAQQDDGEVIRINGSEIPKWIVTELSRYTIGDMFAL